MNFKELPSQEYLKECFDYDAETGNVYWVDRPRNHFNSDRGCFIFNNLFANTKAGCITTGLYLSVHISKYGRFQLHRIIWELVTGYDPINFEIDHINLNRSDNRWCNLRLSNVSGNNTNKHLQKNNTSSFKGVNLHKQSGLWRARISHNKIRYSLGLFKTKELAAEAYLVEMEKLHKEFGRFK
jgi:hypothetical protein